ncbi:hypothetical protein KI688_007713 [Linnemannia hyalina]|uniref:Uncharacterized protein n=1 Tax=Linnemannia hyalina TaxID=64524 RepID=A0A9P7XIJ8_9FUNG|nr:hypothetical protein KI688_007713 [Linnemannia hyalina]
MMELNSENRRDHNEFATAEMSDVDKGCSTTGPLRYAVDTAWDPRTRILRGSVQDPAIAQKFESVAEDSGIGATFSTLKFLPTFSATSPNACATIRIVYGVIASHVVCTALAAAYIVDFTMALSAVHGEPDHTTLVIRRTALQLYVVFVECTASGADASTSSSQDPPFAIFRQIKRRIKYAPRDSMDHLTETILKTCFTAAWDDLFGDVFTIEKKTKVSGELSVKPSLPQGLVDRATEIVKTSNPNTSSFHKHNLTTTLKTSYRQETYQERLSLKFNDAWDSATNIHTPRSSTTTTATTATNITNTNSDSTANDSGLGLRLSVSKAV